MGLTFCCPTCGANLRADPQVAPFVSCPGCGEPIRVPHKPHPVESAPDAPPIPAAAVAAARRGLRRLLTSLVLFALAGVFVLTSLGIRVGGPPYPAWVPTVLGLMAGGWAAVGLSGCWIRFTGYSQCRAAATAVGVGEWAKVATAGTGLTAVGVVAVCPWLIGRPFLVLPPEAVALVLIGLLCGMAGVALEFAFLAVLHRVLWEAGGWQAAAATSRYTVGFVFATVAGMGSVCLGAMVAVLAFGGRDGLQAGANPPDAIWVAAAVLGALTGCAAWAVWRYARLLTAAVRALDRPEVSTTEVKTV